MRAKKRIELQPDDFPILAEIRRIREPGSDLSSSDELFRFVGKVVFDVVRRSGHCRCHADLEDGVSFLCIKVIEELRRTTYDPSKSRPSTYVRLVATRQWHRETVERKSGRPSLQLTTLQAEAIVDRSPQPIDRVAEEEEQEGARLLVGDALGVLDFTAAEREAISRWRDGRPAEDQDKDPLRSALLKIERWARRMRAGD